MLFNGLYICLKKEIDVSEAMTVETKSTFKGLESEETQNIALIKVGNS